jgi:hypothetical protein
VPASLISARSPPAAIRAISAGVRSRSLCSCSDTNGVVIPKWRSSTAL